jgi:steroid Delta-isomerase
MTRSAAEAFAAHVAAWNGRDRTAWMAIFAEDVTLDDPVGAPTKHGLGALATTWERSQRADRRWILVPHRVIDAGSEAAIDLRNEGHVDGQDVVVESIEIWRVRDDGLVTSVRTFFAVDPIVHDPYYYRQNT